MPGLTQAKFANSGRDAVYSADVMSHPSAERAPGVNMANHGHYIWWAQWEKNAYGPWRNPFSGNTWAWDENDNGFGYTGQMWAVSNTTYVIGAAFNKTIRLNIGGHIIENHDSTSLNIRTYTATATGWVDFDARLFYTASYDPVNWVGVYGPDVWGATGWRGHNMGLAYNTNNFYHAYPVEEWATMTDPGDASLFRTVSSPFMKAPRVSFDGKDFSLSANVQIEAGYLALAGYGDVYGVTNTATTVKKTETAPAAIAARFTDLATNTTYAAAAAARGAGEFAGATDFKTSPDTFHTGKLWLEFGRDAHEEGLVNGVVRVRRTATPDSTRLPLTVYYMAVGSAVPGYDFAVPLGRVVIPAGSDRANIPIVPLVSTDGSAPTFVHVTLRPGLYYHDPAPVPVNIGKRK